MKSEATSLQVTNKISITFHEFKDQPTKGGFTIFPAGTVCKTQRLTEFFKFEPSDCDYGIFTTAPDPVVTIMDGDKFYTCSKNGIIDESGRKRVCEFLVKNGVLLEYYRGSTYLLLKDKRFALTHIAQDWVDLVGSGALTVIHSSGELKIAKMVKAPALNVSTYHLNALLEVCHE